MKITCYYDTAGNSIFNKNRNIGEELYVDLYLGGIKEDLQTKYIKLAHTLLNDNLFDEEIEHIINYKLALME